VELEAGLPYPARAHVRFEGLLRRERRLARDILEEGMAV
jgi:hypothetical protein